MSTTKLRPRARIITVTATSGHTFSLGLRVERNALGEPICNYRINQFETHTRLVGGEEPCLTLLGSERDLPALRAQLGVTLEKGFNVPLAPETYLAVEAAATELLAPFRRKTNKLRRSALVVLGVVGVLVAWLCWIGQHPAKPLSLTTAGYWIGTGSWLLLVRAIYLPKNDERYSTARALTLLVASMFYGAGTGIGLSIVASLVKGWFSHQLQGAAGQLWAIGAAVVLMAAAVWDYRRLVKKPQ